MININIKSSQKKTHLFNGLGLCYRIDNHKKQLNERNLLMATMQEFMNIDIRVGKIIDVQDFPEARKPAYKLKIDFGPEIGIKKSSAQIVDNYSKQDLVGRLVLCVTNFAPRQIGSFMSEVLTLGVPAENGTVVLVEPQRDVPIGGRLY